MKQILSLAEIDRTMVQNCGGKAVNLAILSQLHLIPETIVLSSELYRRFVYETGLDRFLQFELQKRPLDQMRWEELWDLSLRIKNRFANTSYPKELEELIVTQIPESFLNATLAVRSSSPIEDSSAGSFAGLHESYLAISGRDSLLEHIKLVWASLFSESALMYRTELSLEQVESVSMAVVVQKMVASEVSGVVFTQSPVSESEMIIEAVRGLNQGLVDDTVEPDRWHIDRATGAVLSSEMSSSTTMIQVTEKGITETEVAADLCSTSTLSDSQVSELIALAQKIESHFGSPQDIEWTIEGEKLILLQCRPITTLREDTGTDPLWEKEDKRPWYKSLTRSFENLKRLALRVEKEILPGMEQDALQMESCDLHSLKDNELLREIQSRNEIHHRWVTVYWDELIPFAHGSRLFGEFYTMRVKPENPFEFLQLLQKTPLISMQRNEALHNLAVMVRNSSDLKKVLVDHHELDHFPEFNDSLNRFIEQYGDLTFKSERLFQEHRELLKLIISFSEKEDTVHVTHTVDMSSLEQNYYAAVPENEKDFATELLELGRASYLFRDNDNIILSRVESQLLKAVQEGEKRLSSKQKNRCSELTAEEVIFLMEHPESQLERTVQELESDEPIEHRGQKTALKSFSLEKPGFKMNARQLIGQSAGEGFAKGVARVIEKTEDLFAFQPGEILVCDSIDPNMTFVVPLASAIVERRGGMLVHGAIIAREYGLPCITGVANLTSLIKTGNVLSVDGYLGVVTVHETDMEG